MDSNYFEKDEWVWVGRCDQCLRLLYLLINFNPTRYNL